MLFVKIVQYIWLNLTNSIAKNQRCIHKNKIKFGIQRNQIHEHNNKHAAASPVIGDLNDAPRTQPVVDRDGNFGLTGTGIEFLWPGQRLAGMWIWPGL